MLQIFFLCVSQMIQSLCNIIHSSTRAEQVWVRFRNRFYRNRFYLFTGKDSFCSGSHLHFFGNTARVSIFFFGMKRHSAFFTVYKNSSSASAVDFTRITSWTSWGCWRRRGRWTGGWRTSGFGGRRRKAWFQSPVEGQSKSYDEISQPQKNALLSSNLFFRSSSFSQPV